MKNFLDIVRNLLEAEDRSAEKSQSGREFDRPTKFADDDIGPPLDFSQPENLGDLSTVDSDGIPYAPHPDGRRSVPGSTASGARTRAAMGGVALPAAAAGHLAHLRAAGLDQDEIDDIEAFRLAGLDDDDTENTDPVLGTPEEVTPQNLPALISHALALDNEDRNPEWHMVKHLPGYLQNGIRTMGRAVFAPFTTTPIEQILVLSTLSNPVDDVKFMMQWIVDNGTKNDEAELVFYDIMPEYAAKTQIYDYCGGQFMLVKDFAGYYIYGWPSASSIRLDGPAVNAEAPSLPGSTRRLR